MKSKNFNKIVTGVLAIAVILALTACTRKQVTYWQNSSTLYERALAVTKNNTFVHRNVGAMLGARGEFDEAIKHFRYVLYFVPNDSLTHYNLAHALELQGKYDEAIFHFQKAIAIDPDNEEAQFRLKALLLEHDKSSQ